MENDKGIFANDNIETCRHIVVFVILGRLQNKYTQLAVNKVKNYI